MSYDEIMNEIKAGLTGNKDKDMVYLLEMAEMYKNHEFSQEIAKACAILLTELLPEKTEETESYERGNKSVEEVMQDVRGAIQKKEYRKALSIVNQLAEEADQKAKEMAGDDCLYFDFMESFEQMLYVQQKRPEKNIRVVNFPFVAVYLTQGSLLVEVGSAEEANAVLAKALQWNPVNMSVRAEYMETLKLMRRLDEFFEMTIESFKYAFRPEDLSRCYRNLGWYFIEKELFSEAIGMYILSIQYDKQSGGAENEMFYIKEMDPDAKAPTQEEMGIISERYGFPIGPSPEVLQIGLGYGKYHLEKIQPEAARYCLKIVYDLTKSEEVKKMLDRIP